MTARTACLDRALALTEAPDEAPWDTLQDTWEPRGTDLRLGEPGPISGGPTAAWFTGASEVRDTLDPDLGGGRKRWSLVATACLERGTNGTILSISEEGLDRPVRALVVRARQLAVVGADHPWRDAGQALWSTNAMVDVDGWTHVGATYDGEQLVLFIDGQVSRVRPARIHPGRHNRQTIRIGSATRFAGEIIPGWRGWLQNVELYNDALTLDEMQAKARTALGIPAPTPPAPRPAAPIVKACDFPAHQPAWRANDAGELTCLQCTPPRGCAFDEHERHWRPVGDVFSISGGWELECGLCIATASQLAAAA